MTNKVTDTFQGLRSQIEEGQIADLTKKVKNDPSFCTDLVSFFYSNIEELKNDSSLLEKVIVILPPSQAKRAIGLLSRFDECVAFPNKWLPVQRMQKFFSSENRVELQKVRDRLLLEASEAGNLALVEVLLERGANINARAENGKTPLHLAGEKGYGAIVILLLHKGALLNIRDDSGYGPMAASTPELTPLFLSKRKDYLDDLLLDACHMKRSDLVKLFLAEGAKTHRKSKETPLHSAARSSDREIVRLLIEAGADVKAKDEKGQTPLHVANNLGIIDLLLVAGAEVDAIDNEKQTPLHSAVRYQNKTLVVLLLKNKADITAKDNNGDTPLHYACRLNNKENISLLLKEGASVLEANDAGKRPFETMQIYIKTRLLDELLWNACGSGAFLLVEKLLQAGADFNKHTYRTPLHTAAENGHTKVVKLLLDAGADIAAKEDDKKQTALHLATAKGHEETVLLLLNNGAAIEAKDKSKQTPLHVAITEGHEKVVSLLLEKKGDVKAKNNAGQTPLHLASNLGHENFVRLLLKNSAVIDEKNNSQQTPFHLACLNGHEKIASILLEEKADIKTKDIFGQTPLFSVTSKGDEKITGLLLEKGADIETKNSCQQTPLHIASAHGHDKVVFLLLKKKAPIDATNASLQTPLHLACIEGHEQIVSLLLKEGASVNAQDNSKKTPLYLAIGKKSKEIVTLLLDKGASIDDLDMDDIRLPAYFSPEGALSSRKLLISIGKHGGKLGLAYMRHLLSIIKDFSYIALKKAHEVALLQNDHDIALLLENSLNSFEESKQICKDTIDLGILLTMKYTPSGYRPLGDLPIRAGWKPLTEGEFPSLPSASTDASYFEELTLIEDDLSYCSLKEIRKTEARLYHNLYLAIVAGKTPLEIKGDEKFQKEVHDLLRAMMTTPSGRWLLLFTCRREKKLMIEPSTPNAYNRNFPDGTPAIGLDLSVKACAYPSLDENLQPIEKKYGNDAVLFHELVHALHDCPKERIGFDDTWDPNNDNIEELRTITGLPMNSNHLDLVDFSENMYNFERNYAERYGHCSFEKLDRTALQNSIQSLVGNTI